MKAVSKSAIIILGASGDLANRKLIPALLTLFRQGRIDNSCMIIGSGRSEFNDSQFREKFDIPEEFAKILFYHQGIKGLKSFVESKGDFDRAVIFFALPPSVYGRTAEELFREGFGKESAIIVEKPFGYDYTSARELNLSLNLFFSEDQIFRIDHYLAKEAVQNILVFRFANSLFEPVWNSRYIESIQINAFEEIGVGSRGPYFDKAGILRDMVQNHLSQLLSLMMMEPPVSLNSEDIRVQKINVLKSIEYEKGVFYQYSGYRDEHGVAPDSDTETYGEMMLKVNNFRWTGMPVYIRSGKALNRRGTEIGIRFKSLPKLLFNQSGTLSRNTIIFKIQPAEGIILDLSSKVPGGGDIQITDTSMRFCYRDSFAEEIPEAYQRLLLDALRRDRTLFVSAKETEISWQKIDKLLPPKITGTYRQGEVPESKLCEDWINFDSYGSVC